MLDGLAGRVAVITGGGSGIGAALARACAAAQMKVVVADLSRERADEVSASIRGDAQGVLAVEVDVADAESVELAAKTIDREFGAPDLLCNNAGVSPFGLLWEFAPEDWNWVLGVNVIGVANCIRSFVPRMIAAGRGGHIVNTASAAGLHSEPRLGAYCATKHAVLGLSDSLRFDVEPHNIGVSVLCPGGVNTNIQQTLARRSSKDPANDLAADVAAFMGVIDPVLGVAIEPDQVAALVLHGVRNNWRYIVTAPGMKATVAARYNRILDAFDDAKAADPALP